MFYIRIFQIPKLSNKLKQISIPLSYTPRKIAVHPENQLFYLIESDHRTWGSEAKEKRLAELVSVLKHTNAQEIN
jgi:splicing factor 3B subunit 3